MSSSHEGLFFPLLLSPLPSWWIAIMFLLMAAPYSHSLPQLTQEPVSSTSVNSADYSKMMRKARRLFTAPTDSRHFCYHLHPWLTGIWPGSIFRRRLPCLPSCLPCPGSRELRGLCRSPVAVGVASGAGHRRPSCGGGRGVPGRGHRWHLWGAPVAAAQVKPRSRGDFSWEEQTAGHVLRHQREFRFSPRKESDSFGPTGRRRGSTPRNLTRGL